MKYDELAHYGVKGMKWRHKKGTIIDPSNTSIRARQPDSTPRIGREKNLVLTGTKNKKFQTNEREVDNKDERESLNEKMKADAIADREAREEAARLAAQRLLEQARSRASKKKETPKEEPKKDKSYPKSSSIIFANTTMKDYYKTVDGKYRLKSKKGGSK